MKYKEIFASRISRKIKIKIVYLRKNIAMEIVKVTDQMKDRIVDKAKKLHTLNPTEWVHIVSDDALKIVQTLRTYMRMGYLEKRKLKLLTGKDGKIFVKFS